MIKVKFNLINLAAGIFLILQIVSFTTILSFPLPASAQSSSDAAKSLQFTPQVPIPNTDLNKTVDVGKYNPTSGKMESDLLARYIFGFYNYGLAIAGILATIVLMGGGVVWLVSAGDPGKIGQAKELIAGSISGVIILVIAWMLLNTINPNLVNLTPIKTTTLTKVTLDSDDGIINSLNNAPTDTEVKWFCSNTPDDSCIKTVPPSINLDINICRAKLGEHSSCPYRQIWCCGESASDQKKSDEYCYGRQPGEDCKLTITSIGTDGYCENNKCNPCKKIGDACSGGSKNYECPGESLFNCGESSRTSDCDCGVLGLGNCTCKETWK